MLKKIGVIGGGYIGGVLVQEIAQRRLAREVGVIDPAPMPKLVRSARPAGSGGEAVRVDRQSARHFGGPAGDRL